MMSHSRIKLSTKNKSTRPLWNLIIIVSLQQNYVINPLNTIFTSVISLNFYYFKTRSISNKFFLILTIDMFIERNLKNVNK